jgi:nicotinamidase-related amidase
MIEIEGKQVFTELDELVDPDHTALVVVDMQRDFCVPGWAFDRLGVDLAMYPPMIPRLARLIEAARAASVPVIYVQMTVLPGRASESPAQIRFNLRLHLASHGEGEPLLYTLEGSEGQAIIDELAPKPGDLVVKKYRSSGFWGTNLDLLLGSNGIKLVVMTGATTEGCVDSTARDALFNDYYVVIVEDCVASDDREQHDASLLVMRHRFDIATAEEIAAVWSRRETAATQRTPEADSHDLVPSRGRWKTTEGE